MNFKRSPENQPDIERSNLNETVLTEHEEDMHDLFYGSNSPLEVLIAEIKRYESKDIIDKDTANRAVESLQKVTYKNEDDFVTQTTEIMRPVLEITHKGRKDIGKQEGLDLYTKADIEATTSIAKESDSKKIYVAGNVGSGKTTFTRELSHELGYKNNIDVDQWFRIFRQEKKREAELPELLEFILQKVEPPFVINHADILYDKNLAKVADMVVHLNPKKSELFKTRKLRSETEIGKRGGWTKVKIKNYDLIEKENSRLFESLGGDLKYHNEKSGTSIRLLKEDK